MTETNFHKILTSFYLPKRTMCPNKNSSTLLGPTQLSPLSPKVYSTYPMPLGNAERDDHESHYYWSKRHTSGDKALWSLCTWIKSLVLTSFRTTVQKEALILEGIIAFQINLVRGKREEFVEWWYKQEKIYKRKSLTIQKSKAFYQARGKMASIKDWDEGK